MDKDEALKLAANINPYGSVENAKARDAAIEVLAQPEQEPVAWMREDEDCTDCIVWEQTEEHTIPLYTAPSQREWVGLTDEDRKPLIQQAMMYYGHNKEYWLQTSGAGFCLLAKAIEAKLREKNT